MKKRPKIKKYPIGGKVNPKTYSMDEYNSLLSNYKTINPLDNKEGNDVKDYIGNYIAPNMKNYQGQLNTALRSKYKMTPDAPITNQYLSPEEANTAVGGKYDDYMSNFDAYQAYRAKTPQMPQRAVEGNITENPKIYGQRHVNLFNPYNANAQKPILRNGGRLPKYQQAPIVSAADQQYADDQYDPYAQERQDQLYADQNAGVDSMNNTNKGLNSGQYAAMGAAAIGGGMQAYGASQDPNSNSIERTRAINSGVNTAKIGVATAINPLLGAAVGGVTKVGEMVQTKVDKTDPVTGKIIKPNSSRAGQVAGTLLSPSQALLATYTDKNATTGQKIAATLTGGLSDMFTDRHKNQVESSALADINANKIVEPIIDTKDYRQDAAWQRLNNHYGDQGEYAEHGGMLNGAPNAELEKQEAYMIPRFNNGGMTNQITGQVDFPSHAQGGGDINLPPGTEILSDSKSLKLPSTGKTPAISFKPFQKIKDQVAKIRSKNDYLDPTSRASLDNKEMLANFKFKSLYGEQEQLKEDKVTAYAKKVGYTLPQVNQQQLPVARMGGQLPQYQFAGNIPYNSIQQSIDQQNALDNMEQMPQRQFQPLGIPASTPDQLSIYANPYATEPPIRQNRDYSQYIEPGINAAVQAAPHVADWIRARKWDKEDYGQLTPKLFNPKTVDASESIRDAHRQATASRNALKGMVGGNAGAFMANNTQLAAQNALAIAKIRQDNNNNNTGILNRADEGNAGINNDFLVRNKELSMASRRDTQANEAAARTIGRQAERNTSNVISNSYNDVKRTGQDNDILNNYIAKAYPNYKFDKKKGWYFNSKGEELNIKEGK